MRACGPRERAIDLLQHYFRVAIKEPRNLDRQLAYGADNDNELAALVDFVIEAAREGMQPARDSKGVRDQDLIREAYGHLGAAVTQSLPTDDQITAEHLRAAHDLLGLVIQGGA